MTPSKLSEKVIADRVKWVREMLAGIKSLPLEDYDAFRSDSRNVAAAESYLRRSLESLLDLGRHVISKGFGIGVTEYKQIAQALRDTNILPKEAAEKLRVLAGYRNRMVHFYHEISRQEIYDICIKELPDVEHILDLILRWVKDHPEMINNEL